MKKISWWALSILLITSLAVGQEGNSFDSEDSEDFNDTEQVLLDQFPPEDEPLPPLEPPYVDAETQQLDSGEKRTVKRKKAPRASTQKTQPENGDETVEPGKGVYRKKYIKHPQAKRGLFKITKSGEYLYKVKPSEKNHTASLRIGFFSAPNFINVDNNASYNDIYGGNDLIFFFDYEWSLARFIPGLSFKLGSGLHYAKGNGRLESTGEEALEEFSFFMFPNTASLAYKFRFSDKQWFYPYVEGGVGAFVFTERRDDNQPPLGRWGAAYNLQAVGGVALSVSALSRDRALRLDAEYGVNEVWFTVDIRQIIGFGNFDISSTLINGGFTVDF